MKFTLKWKVVPYNSNENQNNSQDYSEKLTHILKNKIPDDQKVSFYNKILNEYKNTHVKSPVPHMIHPQPSQTNNIVENPVLNNENAKDDLNASEIETTEFLDELKTQILQDIRQEINKSIRLNLSNNEQTPPRKIRKPSKRGIHNITLNQSIVPSKPKVLKQLEQTMSNSMINNELPPAQATRNQRKKYEQEKVQKGIENAIQKGVHLNTTTDMDISQMGNNIKWSVYR